MTANGFKSLIDSGVQPASTYGAADLARCDTAFEIESGNVIGNTKLAKKIETIIGEIPPPTTKPLEPAQ